MSPPHRRPQPCTLQPRRPRLVRRLRPCAFPRRPRRPLPRLILPRRQFTRPRRRRRWSTPPHRRWSTPPRRHLQLRCRLRLVSRRRWFECSRRSRNHRRAGGPDCRPVRSRFRSVGLPTLPRRGAVGGAADRRLAAQHSQCGPALGEGLPMATSTRFAVGVHLLTTLAANPSARLGRGGERHPFARRLRRIGEGELFTEHRSPPSASCPVGAHVLAVLRATTAPRSRLWRKSFRARRSPISPALCSAEVTKQRVQERSRL
jgi:hypothetical protein